MHSKPPRFTRTTRAAVLLLLALSAALLSLSLTACTSNSLSTGPVSPTTAVLANLAASQLCGRYVQRHPGIAPQALAKADLISSLLSGGQTTWPALRTHILSQVSADPLDQLALTQLLALVDDRLASTTGVIASTSPEGTYLGDVLSACRAGIGAVMGVGNK